MKLIRSIKEYCGRSREAGRKVDSLEGAFCSKGSIKWVLDVTITGTKLKSVAKHMIPIPWNRLYVQGLGLLSQKHRCVIISKVFLNILCNSGLICMAQLYGLIRIAPPRGPPRVNSSAGVAVPQQSVTHCELISHRHSFGNLGY